MGLAEREVEAEFAALPSGRIEWLGEKEPDEVPEVLSKAGIYVWPGCGEAYGLAYLEAQAAGLPVVAQNTAGVPEVVCAGKTGILTPPDDVDAFAGAIARLLTENGERQVMGQAARNFVMLRTLARCGGDSAWHDASNRGGYPMSESQIWQPLLSELAGWERAGRKADFWLRDDDAVEPTAALDRLLTLTEKYGVPVALAVIPAFTGAALAKRLDEAPHAVVAVHGWSHENHAAAGEKKQELGSASRPGSRA